VIARVRLSKHIVNDEQGGFQSGRGCVDQVSMQQLLEKACEKDCKLHTAYMDMDKIHDRVNKEGS